MEGNHCPQHDFMSGEFRGDEDCLFLNVFTTKVTDQQSDYLIFGKIRMHGVLTQSVLRNQSENFHLK